MISRRNSGLIEREFGPLTETGKPVRPGVVQITEAGFDCLLDAARRQGFDAGFAAGRDGPMIDVHTAWNRGPGAPS